MSKLNEILEDQHTEARREQGRTIVRKLYRGLRVEMTCAVNDVVIAITRDDVFPSDLEWKTICEHLPFFSEKVQPFRVQQPGRFILTGTLKPVNQVKFL